MLQRQSKCKKTKERIEETYKIENMVLGYMDEKIVKKKKMNIFKFGFGYCLTHGHPYAKQKYMIIGKKIKNRREKDLFEKRKINELNDKLKKK